MSWIVGCDTGGTFTDVFAVSDTGDTRVAKVPSTPPHFDVGGRRGRARAPNSTFRGRDRLSRHDGDDERRDHEDRLSVGARDDPGLPGRARDPSRKPRGALRHPLGPAAPSDPAPPPPGSRRAHRLRRRGRPAARSRIRASRGQEDQGARPRVRGRLPDQRAHEPGPRAAGARAPPGGASRPSRLAVDGHPAGATRVRADGDHRGERVLRPHPAALHGQPRAAARRRRVSERHRPRHAQRRRHDDHGLRQRCVRQDA